MLSWRQRLFRLWCVISGIWVVFAVWWGLVPAMSETPLVGWSYYILFLFQVATVPPLVILFIGRLLLWVLGIFRLDKE